MMFWRVFMRISYSCPAHLKFGLTVEQWSNLVTLTDEAIDWLDANDKIYDVWLIVAYAATSCALVQVCSSRKPKIATFKEFFQVPYLGTTQGRRCSNETAEIERLCAAMGGIIIA